MSDWDFLNRHRASEPSRTVPPQYCSTPADGCNGLFRFNLGGKLIRVIASDGGGWQHISVSIEYERKPPSWEIMCKVKDLFFEPEDVAVQFHPRASEYINNHPGCLHLWRCTDREFPTPPSLMVGLKQLNV